MCLNEGCIPSKALLYSAKVYETAKHADKYGVKVPEVTLDHKAVVARRGKVVKVLVAGRRGEAERRGRHRREGGGENRGPRRAGGYARGKPTARPTRPGSF